MDEEDLRQLRRSQMRKLLRFATRIGGVSLDRVKTRLAEIDAMPIAQQKAIYRAALRHLFGDTVKMDSL